MANRESISCIDEPSELIDTEISANLTNFYKDACKSFNKVSNINWSTLHEFKETEGIATRSKNAEIPDVVFTES
jgi:hypothetical protein